MRVFVNAVITGFGFSLGKAIFERVSDRLGIGKGTSADKDNGRIPPITTFDGDDDGPDDGGDMGLRSSRRAVC